MGSDECGRWNQTRSCESWRSLIIIVISLKVVTGRKCEWPTLGWRLQNYKCEHTLWQENDFTHTLSVPNFKLLPCTILAYESRALFFGCWSLYSPRLRSFATLIEFWTPQRREQGKNESVALPALVVATYLPFAVIHPWTFLTPKHHILLYQYMNFLTLEAKTLNDALTEPGLKLRAWRMYLDSVHKARGKWALYLFHKMHYLLLQLSKEATLTKLRKSKQTVRRKRPLDAQETWGNCWPDRSSP